MKEIKNISVPRFSRIFIKEAKMVIKSLYYYDEIVVNGKTKRRKQQRPTDFISIIIEQTKNHTTLWIGDNICETAVVWPVEEIMEWLNTWMQGTDHKYTITYTEATKSIIVRVFAEPCKEFLMLNKYLKKHGGFILGDWDYYHVPCRKKPDTEEGYEEFSYRNYLCNQPGCCHSILTILKQLRAQTDYLSLEMRRKFSDGLYNNCFDINILTKTGIHKDVICSMDYF